MFRKLKTSSFISMVFVLLVLACVTGISYAASVTSVWGGARHCIILKSDGTVWDWGYNFYSWLGDGTTTERHTPIQVHGPGDVGYLGSIIAVMGGEQHGFAIKSGGTVWSWGWNSFGQLGTGNTTDSYTPVQTVGLSNVVALGGRGYHSLALKSDGTVWAWGFNRNGQLGNNTTTNSSTPVQVIGLSGVTATPGHAVISGGYEHSMAIKNGTVWAWGLNSNGQLGDGTTTERHTPVQINGLSGITDISCGWDHTIALKNDGTVWTWGGNATGEIGDGSTTNRLTPYQVPGLTNVVAVSGGDCHSAALKSDGTVWTWGCNGQNGNGATMIGSGELGDGTNIDRHSPVQVKNLTNVVLLAARDYHNIAVKSDGTVWTWGFNENGQLGDGTTTDRNIAVAVIGLGGTSSAPVPVFDKAGWLLLLICSGLVIAYYFRRRTRGTFLRR